MKRFVMRQNIEHYRAMLKITSEGCHTKPKMPELSIGRVLINLRKRAGLAQGRVLPRCSSASALS
jgi:hypothetical protein